ncbi:MAG: MmcQ/YjbR family DNA-binding protein [Pseudomonadota bacterium]
MTGDDVNAFCLSLPGTKRVIQWGESNVYKIAEKMFAVMGSEGIAVTLKCPDDDTARMLIDAGAAERAPYLARGGWVRINIGTMPDKELRARLEISYSKIRSSLTKSIQADLPVYEPEKE